MWEACWQRNLFFFFVCGKRRCLPNEATAGLFSTVNRRQVSAVSSPHYMTCFFFLFSFGCHTLPLTQPWNTIPLCHLHKLVKPFLFFFFFYRWVSPFLGKCCCFRVFEGAHEASCVGKRAQRVMCESPTLINVINCHHTDWKWTSISSLISIITPVFRFVFTWSRTLKDLVAYSLSLFTLRLLSDLER